MNAIFFVDMKPTLNEAFSHFFHKFKTIRSGAALWKETKIFKIPRKIDRSHISLLIIVSTGLTVITYDLIKLYEKMRPIPKLSPIKFKPFEIESVSKLTNDTNLIRIKANGSEIDACSHVDIKDDSCQIARSYTPVNSTPEFIDLVVKKYGDGAQVSKMVCDSNAGDSLLIRGPINTLKYEANAVKDVAMICGGTGINIFITGITPMYQIIKRVLTDPNDDTKLHLFYANKTKGDILLHRELDIIAKAYPEKFKLYLSVDTADDEWDGFKGRISEEILAGRIPHTEVAILVCGPDGFVESVCGAKGLDGGQGPLNGILKRLGFLPVQVFKF